MKERLLSRSGYLLLISVVIGWGTSWPFLKIALNEIPPWTFRGLIAPVAGIFMFCIGFFLKEKILIPKAQWKQLLVVSLFNISLWHIFSAWGISLLGSGQASIIAYTMPLWAVAFSIMLNHEKPHLQRLLGLGLGIVGIMILAVGELGIFASSPIGTVMMLAAALAWGIGTAVHKSINWEVPAITLASWQLLIGGLPITIVAVFLEIQIWPLIFENISVEAILSTIFILVYPIIFCWFAWFQIVSEVSVVISAVSIMLVPVIGVFSSQILLGEVVGIKEMISLVLVCSSLAFVLLPKFTAGDNKNNLN